MNFTVDKERLKIRVPKLIEKALEKAVFSIVKKMLDNKLAAGKSLSVALIETISELEIK